MDAVTKIYSEAGFIRPKQGRASWVSPSGNVLVFCDRRYAIPGVQVGQGKFKQMWSNPVARARFAVRAERLMVALKITPKISERASLLRELYEHEREIARIRKELKKLDESKTP